jgi:hypothetical protein
LKTSMSRPRTHSRCSDVVYASRLRFDPGSWRLPVARPVRYVLRGGVLEPGARNAPEIRRQKQLLLIQRQLPLQSGRGPFSLRRGLECLPCLLQLSITFRGSWLSGVQNDEGDPFGSPSLRAAMPPYD